MFKVEFSFHIVPFILKLSYLVVWAEKFKVNSHDFHQVYNTNSDSSDAVFVDESLMNEILNYELLMNKTTFSSKYRVVKSARTVSPESLSLRFPYSFSSLLAGQYW
jgi:hypothetical protein